MHIEAQSLGQISHFCYKSDKNDSWRQLTNNRFHKTPFYGAEIAGSCRFKHYF